MFNCINDRKICAWQGTTVNVDIDTRHAERVTVHDMSSGAVDVDDVMQPSSENSDKQATVSIELWVPVLE